MDDDERRSALAPDALGDDALLVEHHEAVELVEDALGKGDEIRRLYREMTEERTAAWQAIVDAEELADGGAYDDARHRNQLAKEAAERAAELDAEARALIEEARKEAHRAENRENISDGD